MKRAVARPLTALLQRHGAEQVFGISTAEWRPDLEAMDRGRAGLVLVRALA